MSADPQEVLKYSSGQNYKNLNCTLPVGAYSVERPKLAEWEVVHEEMEQSGRKTTGKHSGEIVAVNLHNTKNLGFYAVTMKRLYSIIMFVYQVATDD